MRKLALIMLAAGSSRRFGSNKLLYPVEGRAMYQRILEKLIWVRERLGERKEGISANVTVVTQYEEIGEYARRAGAEVFYNPHPQEGIASSIRIGVKANREAEACLFTVSDQPWIRGETIEDLIDLYLTSHKSIACVLHKGRTGNPCIFSGKYYPRLLALTGDLGGKSIITAHRDDTAVLEVEDGRELRDVDVRL